MTGDERTTEVEPALRSYGISVESIDEGDPLKLTYMTAFPGREVHHGEIGRALNTLIDRADAGEWDPVRVEATVVRSPGDVLGTWHAEPEWFEALAAYEITETEFSARVLETLSHADDPATGEGTGPSEGDDGPTSAESERDSGSTSAESDEDDGPTSAEDGA